MPRILVRNGLSGEIALTLTILSALIMGVGIVAGTIALKQTHPLQSNAAEVCLPSTSLNRTTISQGNTTYKLCSGQNYTGGIDISASDVTLDGAGGPIIDGGNNANISGIKITAANVTVKNTTVKGFRYGLEAQNTAGTIIENSNFSENSKGGTDSDWLGALMNNKQTGGGILFENISNSQIASVQAEKNIAGITLLNSQNIEVSDGNFSNNSGWGIRLITTSNSLLKNNIANNNTRYNSQCPNGGCEAAAIMLIDDSNNNIIDGNTLNNSGDGFYINGNGSRKSNNNKIINNVADADDKNFSGNGFEATFSEGNVFQNNSSTGHNYGFWLGFSHKSVLDGNTADAREGGISIPASQCNAILNNTTKSGNPNLNHIFEESEDMLGISRLCKDNYVVNNTPPLGTNGCTNTQTTVIPSCDLSITPAPTTPANTPQPSIPQTSPPNPTSPGGDGDTTEGGTLLIRIYKVNADRTQRLWQAQDGQAQVFISGPTGRQTGFSVVMDVPTTSGTCRTDPSFESGGGQGISFACTPGTITWRGSEGLGTAQGGYSVQISRLPSCTAPDCLAPSPYPNPVVRVTAGQTATANLTVVSSDEPFDFPSPDTGPTPTVAASGYSNDDFQKVMDQYKDEEISALQVSSWLTQASRVPGLQKAVCYPPNCEI